MIYEKNELFDIVDIEGNVTGNATRKECHSGSFLLHPVVHLHLFNSSGELYLQKRSSKKLIQPGKWDTAVGGHIDSGEDVISALYRESKEELGIDNFTPEFVGRYPFRSEVEFELVNIFTTVCDSEITIDPIEIDEGRFWTIKEIEDSLEKDIFTPNFVNEFKQWIKLKIIK